MDTIESRFNDLIALMSDDNWANIRNAGNFDLVQKQYEFGMRNTFVPKQRVFNENLQDSRGNGIPVSRSFEEYLKNVETGVSNLQESDRLRINELHEHIIDLERTAFAEVGFRNPRLLKHYAGRFDTVRGFDISNINVMMGKRLGFDCEVWDLNDPTYQPTPVFNTIACYHVLEHTFDPMLSLRKIRQAMRPGGVLHIEIPIEPGTPRLNFGHLIALEHGDLKKMLELASFRVISISNKTHTGGPVIERAVAHAT